MSHKRLSRILNLIPFLAASLLLPGCTWDKEDELYPPVACDTTNVTYTVTIAPIMSAHCNVCHGAATASGGVVTDNYADLKAAAEAGVLWPAVNWTGNYKMPKDGSKLSDCDLSRIATWMSQGYRE